jgi:hypothetical protein
MKGKIEFTIKGDMEISENLDDLKACLECIEDAVQKTREWGRADLTYSISANGCDKS